MRIAIYARVSTSDGRQSTENQLPVLREWAKQIASPGIPEIVEYVDNASGSSGKRPEFQKMLSDAQKGRFKTLLIWSLDRLTREGIAKTAGYLTTLRAYGVRVMSRQEAWLDTDGPVSELLVAIFSWIAREERQRIRERIKAGLVRTKAKGTVLGRRPLKIDHQTVWFMHWNGKPIRKIAKDLKVSKTLIGHILKDFDPPTPEENRGDGCGECGG